MVFNPFQNKPLFLFVCSTSLENTGGKGETARNEQFLCFPQCFIPPSENFPHLHENKNCCLQTLSVWKSQNLPFWNVFRAMVQGFYFAVATNFRLF